jgi:DNA-binding NarL/FixJ family response regulator
MKPVEKKGARRVLVVEDHPLTRQGVTHRIRAEPDLEICGGAGDFNAALAAVPASQPDLILVDLSLEGRSGLKLVEELHARYPAVPVLVFSMHYETLYAERALRAGARGYVMKSEGAQKLIDAIRHVLQGKVHLSAVMRDRLVHAFDLGPGASRNDNTALLSDRELKVFRLLGQGLDAVEVARQLAMAPEAMKVHLRQIMEKLKLGSGASLPRAATDWLAKPRS